MTGKIDFDGIARTALANAPELLARWFPAGVRRGREYVLGSLAGDPGESLSINMHNGAWADFSRQEDRGGDLISLYARAFCGGDQGAAARKLSDEMGIGGGAGPTAYAPAAPKKPKEIWEPAPSPGNRPAPDNRLKPNDGIWEYRNADGVILSYVIRRNEENGKKRFVPLTWGRRKWFDEKRQKERDETHWHYLHPATPLPLYGADRLAHRPDAPVIVCEGEKAADAAGAMFPRHVAVCWPRGTGNVQLADFSALAGRSVILWPDNDKPGLKAMKFVADAIADAAADVMTLDVSDLEPCADAADITPEDPAAWMTAHTPEAALWTEPEPENAREPDPIPPPHDDEPPDYFEIPPDAYADPEGIEALGYSRDAFFYYSFRLQQVRELSPGGHSDKNLCAMASIQWWESQPHLSSDRGVKWLAAASYLMDLCRKKGIYSPDSVRGRGAWMDEGRVVVHAGEKLIVDGAFAPLILPGSRHIYERAAPLVSKMVDPLSTADARKLLAVCKLLRWEKMVSARLLAGWIVTAHICGALDWRPSVWLTGGAGSGKTFLVNEIVRPALGEVALYVKMPSTSSGIQGALGSDARPVVLDESETERKSAQIAMADILALLRQGSASDNGALLKGTQTGGFRENKIRSPFLFQSINVSIEHAADASRISVLSLLEAPKKSPESEASFRALCEAAADCFADRNFAAALLARTAILVPTIRANARIFSDVIASSFGSRRAGDQLGALLAGAYSLHTDALVTAEQAASFVAAHEWETQVDPDAQSDEARLLGKILAAPIRTARGEVPVSRLIESVLAADDNSDSTLLPRRDAARFLSETGLRAEITDGADGLYVSSTHARLAEILRDTPWAAGWNRSLARIPGSIPPGKTKSVRFSGGPERPLWIPLRDFMEVSY